MVLFSNIKNLYNTYGKPVHKVYNAKGNLIWFDTLSIYSSTQSYTISSNSTTVSASSLTPAQQKMITGFTITITSSKNFTTYKIDGGYCF